VAERRARNGERQALSGRVGRDAARKLRARDRAAHGIWFGFAMFGLIGWSVVVPTLLGAALGLWLDRHHPGPHSWTLTLMLTGLILGCFNAWHWVSREQRAVQREQDKSSE
jgi:ATP synthase protein I